MFKNGNEFISKRLPNLVVKVHQGKVKLDLHAPFAYLHDISECLRDRAKRSGGRNTKTGSEATGLSDGGRSVNVSWSRGGETRTPDQRIWRPLLYQLSYAPVCITTGF
jgi:hypothetical protein